MQRLQPPFCPLEDERQQERSNRQKKAGSKTIQSDPSFSPVPSMHEPEHRKRQELACRQSVTAEAGSESSCCHGNSFCLDSLTCESVLLCVCRSRGCARVEEAVGVESGEKSYSCLFSVGRERDSRVATHFLAYSPALRPFFLRVSSFHCAKKKQAFKHSDLLPTVTQSASRDRVLISGTSKQQQRNTPNRRDLLPLPGSLLIPRTTDCVKKACERGIETGASPLVPAPHPFPVQTLTHSTKPGLLKGKRHLDVTSGNRRVTAQHHEPRKSGAKRLQELAPKISNRTAGRTRSQRATN